VSDGLGPLADRLQPPPAELRLETDRLLLRLPAAADAGDLATMLCDPEVMQFLGGTTVPRDDVPAVVEKWLGRWRQDGLGPFVLERSTDGRVLGRVGFLVWDTRTWEHATPETGAHGAVELGWAIAREHWGRGYVTEAALAVREWGRERSVERVISLIAPTNTASKRVAERLGAWPTETVRLHDTGPAVVWEHP
jgi:RimJ/RimL family protein N-acetyltransferase